MTAGYADATSPLFRDAFPSAHKFVVLKDKYRDDVPTTDYALLVFSEKGLTHRSYVNYVPQHASRNEIEEALLENVCVVSDQ